MHTPEPWKVWENRMRDDGVFVGADVEPKPYEGGAKDIYGNPRLQLPPMITHTMIDREDADRIVACVNACAGINPEAVPEMYKVLKSTCDASDCEGGIARRLAREVIAKAEKTNG